MFNKTAKMLIYAFAVVTAAYAGELTNGTNRVVDESAPLVGDMAYERTVVVKNKEGKGIQNVQVIVDYDSERHPPSFKTDYQGKAIVKVKQGFWALRVNAGDGAGIVMTIRPQEVEWPCEIILPTRKTKF